MGDIDYCGDNGLFEEGPVGQGSIYIFVDWICTRRMECCRSHEVIYEPKRQLLYYNDLFAKYGITREDFDSCVTYYSLQSALFNKIYDVVIDTLSRRQTKIMRSGKS